MALNNYRSSLKDVAAREAEIRVILRDRDIFVSRVSDTFSISLSAALLCC